MPRCRDEECPQMKCFYIITNRGKDPELKVTDEISAYLRAHGCRVQTDGEIQADTECIVVLGGDGTMIRAARDYGKLSIPMIGINLGTLGYLAGTDRDGVRPTLDKLMADQYLLDDRMMLKGKVFKSGVFAGEELALNDIVIARGGSIKVIQFKIYVNGEYLNQYTADGIIVATPTGSTAYNLSAGGPIVEPNADIVLITPISPHTLNNRSIVLSAKNHISVEIVVPEGKEAAECFAAFDGGEEVPLSPKDVIEIDRSDYRTRICKLSRVSFLETLRNKMSE